MNELERILMTGVVLVQSSNKNLCDPHDDYDYYDDRCLICIKLEFYPSPSHSELTSGRNRRCGIINPAPRYADLPHFRLYVWYNIVRSPQEKLRRAN